MADITDTRVVRFVNEVVRPMAELLRNSKNYFNSENVKWSAEIQTLVPADSSILVDPEDPTNKLGKSILTGADINDFMYSVGLICQTINNIANQTIEKPCVRPVELP